MTPAQVTACDDLARSRFTYLVNSVTQWRSYANAALSGAKWKGDCSDLASTVLDLLGRKHCPLENRYRLLVSTTDREVPDHMIGAVECDGGAWLIVGDTNAPAYPVSEMDYLPIFYNRLSEAGLSPQWRTGAPWRL